MEDFHSVVLLFLLKDLNALQNNINARVHNTFKEVANFGSHPEVIIMTRLHLLQI